MYNGPLSEEAAIRKITFDEHFVKEMPPIPDIRHSEIYSGSNAPTGKVRRQALSTVDDIVCVVTKGRTKPGKQLCVGMGLKSITGSRRVL